MELSGIELRYLVNEIRVRTTSGYYVSGITAVTANSLVFKLHHSTKEDIMLMLSVKGIWITKLKFKQLEEGSIENSLRKEIERAKLESIEQAGSERIVTLRFRHADGRLRIVIGEFFGDGNLIICDENFQIIAILKSVEVRHRTLKVGLRYTSPPSRGTDVFEVSPLRLVSMRDEGKDLEVLKWIGRSTSLPKKFVEEIAMISGIKPGISAGKLSNEDVGRIYSATKNLVERVSTGSQHEPAVILKDSKPHEAIPIMIDNIAGSIKSVSSYMEAVDEVLSSEIVEHGRGSKTVELDKQIGILEHDLEEQNKAKDQVIHKAASIRKLAGELMALLTQGIQYLDESHSQVLLSANSATIVQEKGIRYLQILDENVKINPNHNLAQVASTLFERAKEMERGSESIDDARTKLLTKIEKLRTQTATIHMKITAKEQTVKEWYERYRWFVTSDGLLAIGGRDSSSNSALIRKHLTEHDIVFHAEVHGSPFFIVKNAAIQAVAGQINSTLQEVAQATVSFSRAWKDGLSSADAYWVLPEQIKKGAPSGQYLPKGAFVIEGKRNYIKDIEMRLAISVARIDSRYALVCGPEDTIRKKALVYAVLLQGGMDPMNAAKKAKRELVASAGDSELGELIKSISLDDFVRALPTGQSKISFSGSGGERS